MEYETLKDFLAKLMPKAQVTLASELASEWSGVAVKIGDRVAIAYRSSDVNGPEDKGWLVDHFSAAESDPMAYTPDVWDFGTEAGATSHLLAWYLEAA